MVSSAGERKSYYKLPRLEFLHFFISYFFDNPGKSGTTFLVKSFLYLRHLFYFNLSNYDGLGPLTFLTRCIINYIYTRSWRDSRVYIQTGWQHAQPPGPPHTHLFIFFVTVFFHQKNHDIYAENELILVKCSGLNWIGIHIFKSTFLFSTAVPSKLCMNYIIKFVMYRNNQNQTLVKLENE